MDAIDESVSCYSQHMLIQTSRAIHSTILVRFAINEKLRPFLNLTRFFKLTGQATPSFLQNIVTFVRMSSSKYIYC